MEPHGRVSVSVSLAHNHGTLVCMHAIHFSSSDQPAAIGITKHPFNYYEMQNFGACFDQDHSSAENIRKIARASLGRPVFLFFFLPRLLVLLLIMIHLQ